jgi:hypothetical protein
MEHQIDPQTGAVRPDLIDLPSEIALVIPWAELCIGAVITFSVGGETKHFLIESLKHEITGEVYVRTVRGRYVPAWE